MKVTKTLLQLSTLFSLTIAVAGCTTGTPFGMASFEAPRAPFHTANSTVANGNQRVATASVDRSPTYVARNRTPPAPANQLLQASYHGSVPPVSVAPALVTLGSNDNFQQMIDNATGAVLVDFYADWCGPCRKQGGILHDLESTASQNHASIIKVNIDQHKELSEMFQVSSLPTLILIKDGQVIDRQTGLADHRQVAAWLAR